MTGGGGYAYGDDVWEKEDGRMKTVGGGEGCESDYNDGSMTEAEPLATLSQSHQVAYWWGGEGVGAKGRAETEKHAQNHEAVLWCCWRPRRNPQVTERLRKP